MIPFHTYSTKNTKTLMDSLINKPIKNKFSDNDTDLEHISRSNTILPPRIINPQVLAVYGLNMALIGMIINFIKNGLPPTHLSGKRVYYTGIKGAGYKKLESFKLDSITGKKKTINDVQYGKIQWEIETSAGSKKEKVCIQYRDMPKKWRIMWDLLFFTFITEYLESIFPKHLHFILKDSILTPLPFPYLELFLKAEKATMGNLCADFAEGDTIDGSKY